MNKPINKTQLLTAVRRSQTEWEIALAQLDEASLLAPATCGDWSVKDVIAHLTWHEREMIELIRRHALEGSELWNLPTNERNQAIYQANLDRTLQETHDEAQQVHNILVMWLETLSDEDLSDPARFASMPRDWKPWKLIAENTYEHYQDHLPQIKALAAHK